MNHTVHHKIIRSEIKEGLNKKLFNNRVARILHMRLNNLTTTKIGILMGVTGARVCQLEKNGIRVLRFGYTPLPLRTTPFFPESTSKIEDSQLSTRVKNRLRDYGIRTFGGLVRRTQWDLTDIRGLGVSGIQEIERYLLAKNYPPLKPLKDPESGSLVFSNPLHSVYASDTLKISSSN